MQVLLSSRSYEEFMAVMKDRLSRGFQVRILSSVLSISLNISVF